jgi:hypothetical protein
MVIIIIASSSSSSSVGAYYTLNTVIYRYLMKGN